MNTTVVIDFKTTRVEYRLVRQLAVCKRRHWPWLIRSEVIISTYRHLGFPSLTSDRNSGQLVFQILRLLWQTLEQRVSLLCFFPPLLQLGLQRRHHLKCTQNNTKQTTTWLASKTTCSQNNTILFKQGWFVFSRQLSPSHNWHSTAGWSTQQLQFLSFFGAFLNEG